MNARRIVLGTAGALLVGATALAGGLLSTTPLAAAPDVLGNDYYVVVAIGAAGLAVAVPVLKDGSRVEQTEMPDADGTTTVPAPGDGFEERVDSWLLFVPLAGAQTREEVRERLRDAAVDALRRTENCAAEDARRQIATGEWTDDDVAAEFLADAADGEGPSRFGLGLAAAARGQSGFGYAARRTADALARRAADDRATPDGGEVDR